MKVTMENSGFLSDSRSSLQHLHNWTQVGDKTSISILHNLKISKHHDVHFQWIPSHVDIFGNEQADIASKTAISDWLVDTRKVSPSLRAGRLCSAQVQGSAGLCRTYPGLSGSFYDSPLLVIDFFEGQQFNGSCLTSSDN
ncbi:hypothetical protein TNCV_2210611 [Trichonephila clavipes]|nr:hypothetical protein TNCV_2210611 [Trichonephila clavipes]